MMGNAGQPLHGKAAPAARLKVVTSPSVAERYEQFPLSFEPNQKQSDDAVKFLARGKGYILFLTDKDAVFALDKASHSASVLRMSLLGANAHPVFSCMEELPGKSNYLIGNKPEEWHVNIPNFRKVAERGVYPGIDLVYYGTQHQLEYDFVVAPGASPKQIQIAFDGASKLHTDAQGDLVLSASGKDDIRLRKPIAYQTIGGEKQLVAANFAVQGNNQVAFKVGQYDATRPLIVDPILSYSTYLGGSGIDGANSIAIAPDNTAFIAGSTFSADFPIIHALQPNEGGGPDFPQDGFVSKISADGSTLLYSTYLGGTRMDAANGIAVDHFGDAFVTGTTESANFPVSVASFGTLCGGDGKCGASLNPGGFIVSNAFVTELNPAGTGLVYSGFLGYYENVKGLAIAVDNNGNAYVTGSVGPNIAPTVVIVPPNAPPPPFPDFSAITPPVFVGTFDEGIAAASNAFVTKISSTGSAILYSSYLGGSTEDVGYGIAVDGNSNAYVTGLAYSTDFPISASAIQLANGGAGDAFVSKVNTNATGAASLVYSTFMGGSGLDQGNAIAVDGSGNAFVAGLTNSTTLGFTLPAGGFQPANAGQGDAFITKLNATGVPSYFTFLGGTHADSATGIAVDTLGNAYVTGTTVSTDFPTAGAVFQPAYGGGNADSFVAKLSPTGAALTYSSFLGGTNTELATGIAVDTAGSAYVTGQTCSQDFPLSNPLQAVPGGNCDAYVAKVSILAGFALNPAGLVFPAQSLNTTSQPDTLTITNGDSAQTISSIAITGANASDFTETSNCGASLAVGANCAITVSFTPTASGIRKASVVITDSAPGSPQVVNLTGNTSTVTLSTSSLAFGFQQVGIPSTAQAVTVTNSGTTPLSFSSITASGDFFESDNCLKAALQPSTNCVIQVEFTPSAAVASLGAITLTDNGSGSPQVILTTGTGVLEPQAILSQASLGFPDEPVGTTSPAQSVTLTNPGNAPLNIASIAASGDFTHTTTCGAILAVNGSCSISVKFTPTATGNRAGTLTITDNAANVAGSTQTVQLSGNGLTVPVVTLSTNTLTFSSQAIGSTSPAQAVTLSNIGSAPLVISNVTQSGNFAQINNCGTSVAPGSNCTINVTFTPGASGNLFGTITITDNAAGSPQSIALSGVGAAATFAIGSLTATPSVPAGQTASYAISVTSTGSFSSPVTLTCSAPATITCTVAPSAVLPSSSPTQAATLTVSTALRAIGPPSSGIKIDPFRFLRQTSTAWLALLAAVLLSLAAFKVRRRPLAASFGLAVCLMFALAACSGGGSSSAPAGTPAGQYTITVSGTAGGVTNTTQLALQVK
jgi:hypothetical protein